MKELIPMDEYGIFVDRNDKPWVDSRFVAEKFHKNHNKVLRDIRELDCSENFRQSNFGQSTYRNQQGKRQPCYCMTRDGFAFLVMGYRGKKAAQFKELYIQRFNEMEAFIKDLETARLECPRLTANIQRLHENPKAYHYSNEFNMINRIAIGMSAKQFREAHGIPAGNLSAHI